MLMDCGDYTHFLDTRTETHGVTGAARNRPEDYALFTSLRIGLCVHFDEFLSVRVLRGKWSMGIWVRLLHSADCMSITTTVLDCLVA